ncbi:MAG TPA: hypothetical protein VMB49_04565 [Acidobacteriaceae bacterium]|nr:hypothetical protein [Acidobacteriaceae bacterium]
MNISGKLIAAAALSALFSSVPLYAQLGNGVKFTTPFPFYVGTVRMPSGAYVVNQPHDLFSDVAIIRSANGQRSAQIITNSTESAQMARGTFVTFEKYGHRYYFDRVRVAGENYGIAAVPNRSEKRQEEMASVTSRRSVAVQGE